MAKEKSARTRDGERSGTVKAERLTPSAAELPFSDMISSWLADGDRLHETAPGADEPGGEVAAHPERWRAFLDEARARAHRHRRMVGGAALLGVIALVIAFRHSARSVTPVAVEEPAVTAVTTLPVLTGAATPPPAPTPTATAMPPQPAAPSTGASAPVAAAVTGLGATPAPREPAAMPAAEVAPAPAPPSVATGQPSTPAPEAVPATAPTAPAAAEPLAKPAAEVAVAGDSPRATSSEKPAPSERPPTSERTGERSGAASDSATVTAAAAGTANLRRADGIARSAEPARPAPPPLEGCKSALMRQRARDALANCRQVFASDPRSADAMVLLARADLLAGHSGETLQLAHRAVAANPRNADAFLLIGTVQQTEGRRNEARSAYETYLQLAPMGAHATDVRAILRTL